MILIAQITQKTPKAPKMLLSLSSLKRGNKLEILAVTNQKGGVGKSTTSHNLGQGLQKRGYKVLLVDLDNQQNLSYTMGANPNIPTSYEVLKEEVELKGTIQKTASGDLIAASPQLAGSDRHITQTDILKRALQSIESDYDFVIIDCPPALSILTINALTTANHVIIPAQADIYSLQAISQLHNTIESVKKNANPDLVIAGILLTRYNNRAILSRDLTELINETAQKMQTKVFKSSVREAIAIKECQAMQTDIFTYAPQSNVAKDYSDFIEELLADIQDKGENNNGK